MAEPDPRAVSDDETLSAEPTGFAQTQAAIGERTPDSVRSRQVEQGALLTRGDVLGRYLVLDLLGRGGMGAVYSAFDPELDRKVALKLILARADPTDSSSSADQVRLQREAQAIAQLSHPNVITVHDVGTHAGRVFVTMEFVDGGTLREWADKGAQPWREVLARYLPAGQGLAAAHRAGLVHRDFKPANVLLGTDGRLRVADFGLARRVVGGDLPLALERDATLSDAAKHDSLSDKLTMTGARVGTPAYMAPEQYSGEEVGARADQFAYCVALYEALYGERPFAADTLHALMHEVDIGRIREPRRGTTVPGWLRKALVRGLERDPAKRWPDMDALLRELQRSDGRAWRPWALVGGLLAVLAVVVALPEDEVVAPEICTGVEEAFAGAYDDGDRTAIAARLAELHEAGTAERLLPRLDQWAGDWQGAWENACRSSASGTASVELHAAQLSCLERRRRRFETYVGLLRTADEQLVHKAIEALERVGSPSACSDAEVVLAQVEPPDDPEIRASVEALAGQLDEAHALSVAGRYEAADLALEQLAEPIAATKWRPLLAEFHRLRGQNRGRRRDFPGSESDLAKAIADALAVGDDRLAVAALADQAEFVSDWQPRWTESLHLLEFADALIDRLGGDPSLAAAVEHARAEVLMREGSYEPAVAAAEQSLAAAIRAGGPDSLIAADAHHVLGNALYYVGNNDEGMRQIERAQQLWTTHVGVENPRMLKIHNSLGLFMIELERPKEAIVEFQAELELAEAIYGQDHLNVSDALANLATAYYTAGQLEESRRALERSLGIRERNVGADNLYVGHARANLAGTLREIGDLDAALEQAQLAHGVILAVRGEGHPDLAIVANVLAEIYRDRGDFGLARENVAIALELVLAAGDNPDNLASTRLLYGEIELAGGNAKAALQQVEHVRVQPDYQPTPAYLSEIDWLGARCLLKLGRTAEAREVGQRARDGLEVGEANQQRIVEIDAWLAKLAE